MKTSLTFLSTLSVILACAIAQRCEDPDKVYVECQSSSCIPTCTNPRPGPICTANCLSGCFCRPGLYLDRATNKCRSLRDCHKCGINEIFNNCGTCDGTCNNPKPICAQVCRPGCFCKPGYVRQNGHCIHRSACFSLA